MARVTGGVWAEVWTEGIDGSGGVEAEFCLAAVLGQRRAGGGKKNGGENGGAGAVDIQAFTPRMAATVVYP